MPSNEKVTNTIALVELIILALMAKGLCPRKVTFNSGGEYLINTDNNPTIAIKLARIESIILSIFFICILEGVPIFYYFLFYHRIPLTQEN